MNQQPEYLGQYDAIDQTVFTFSDVPLGNPDTERYIIVTVGARKVGTSGDITNVSIGGVSTSWYYQLPETSDGNNQLVMTAWAQVTDGTSGDVVVTLSEQYARCSVAVWRAVGLSGVNTAASPGTGVRSITVPANGFSLLNTFNSNDEVPTEYNGVFTKVSDVYFDNQSRHANFITSVNSTSTSVTYDIDWAGSGVMSAAACSFQFKGNYIEHKVYTNGYERRKKISVASGKAGGYSFNNFSALVRQTDPDLKSKAYGGKVHLQSLLDIRFEDTAGNKIAHEIENYDPTTGELEAWVLVSLSQSTELYMYYGKNLYPSTINGVLAGYKSSDLALAINFDGNFNTTNPPELMAYSTTLTGPYGSTFPIVDSVPELPGDEAPDYADGYILFRPHGLKTDFTNLPTWNSDYFAVVFYVSGQWKYFDNSVYTNFTPKPYDILVAKAHYSGTYCDKLTPIVAGEEDPDTLWSTTGWHMGVYHMDIPPADATRWTQKDSNPNPGPLNHSGSMTSADSVPGLINKSVELDGVNDIMTRTFSNFAGTASNSMSMWIKTTQQATVTLIQQRDASSSGTAGEFMFKMNANGTLTFFVYNGGYEFNYTSPNPPVNDGVWHHVVASRGGSAIPTIFVDGVAYTGSASGSVKSINQGLVLAFGADYRDSVGYFQGQIDELRLLRVATNQAYAYLNYANQRPENDFFTVATEETAKDGLVAINTGSSWKYVTPKIWNGTSWITAKPKTWDGSSWK